LLSALLVAILLAVSPSSSVVVYPTSIETLSSSDLYVTIHNLTQSFLVSVNVTVPLSIRPVGFSSNSGRWYTSVTAGTDSYRIEWMGGLAPGATDVLGLAVSPAGGPSVFSLTIQEAYYDGTRSNLTQSMKLECPCFLGTDARYLAYDAIALVLLLPAFEIILHKTRVLKRQDS
jgi:hypothetical protein